MSARSTALAAFVLVAAALGGVVTWQSLAPAPLPPGAPLPLAAGNGVLGGSRGYAEGSVGVAGGDVPEGVTVFDDDYPAVANLEPGLLGAVRRAAQDAGGTTFYVNSGWRSTAYQNQLLREAIAKYGSEKEAARWVATARTSPHVSGNAVDIGHSAAAAWLSRHGAAYGLCQIYRNEPWHFELRPGASTDGCPGLYANPTRDPRMQP
jgi:zinc D-Ala-D-Ala carboxypeptidase